MAAFVKSGRRDARRRRKCAHIFESPQEVISREDKRSDHDRHFRRGRRFVPGFGGFGFDDYDYGCSYGYPYYSSYSCYYPPSYY
jgi:hypothetical protein